MGNFSNFCSELFESILSCIKRKLAKDEEGEKDGKKESQVIKAFPRPIHVAEIP